MLLIATAMAEELETVLNLCSRKEKIRRAGVPVWIGTCAGKTLQLLKLGVGPKQAAARLEEALAVLEATRILVVGYAGALDPGLKQGELVVIDKAHLFAEESWGGPLEALELGRPWPLSDVEEMLAIARAAELPAHRGAVITSPCIMGAPEHKRVLFRKFGSPIVDMETAALARVAAQASLPLGCVRAVSDEAEDDYLAALSYDPGTGALQRAAKAAASGGWLRRYGQWRERSQAARRNLSLFLTHYLDRKSD
jgi:adenosylhomocysteine nucleosidase